MSRILVAQADSSVATGGPRFPLSVALVRWRGAEPYLTVTVKAAFDFAGADESPLAEIRAEREPFRLDVPSELEGAADGELGYPSDFVPLKPQCDVLLVGHAYARSPTTLLEASVGIAGFSRRFWVKSSESRRELALCRGAICGPDGTPADAVGPVGLTARESADAAFEELDFGQMQAAAPAQRMVPPPPDAAIELWNLSPGVERRRVQLPAFVPRVVVESGTWGDDVLDLRCDTVWIDTDFERIVLAWRAMRPMAYADAREVQRLVVSLEKAEEPRGHLQVLRSLPRGHLSYAVEEEDVRTGVAVEPDADELELARYETLEHGAEPTLTLEQYAQVSAELAEQSDSRDHVLERHVLDEHSWTLEERGWLERMGEAAMAGDGRIAVEFGQLFVLAQDALRGANEPRSVEEYAELLVAMESAEDPSKVLDGFGMRLAQWMRLDRHWRRVAEQDYRVAEKLERLVAQERAEAAARGGDEGSAAEPPTEGEPA
jgi:hypothetical protein